MTFDLISRNRKDKVYNPNCVNRRMGNPISIEESLKELNDDVLKNIREDYKKGSNLNDIIQHHKTKRPEAISKIYNLIKFEFDEQERFLRTYENIKEVKLFFPTINQTNYEAVIGATLKGMRKGVQDFLNRENLITVYGPKLSYFCYDKTLADKITESVRDAKLLLSENIIPQYSEDVRSGYAFFVYNESKKDFNKRFNLK